MKNSYRCITCKHLKPLELSDEIYCCPVLNIRISVVSIKDFGCSLYSKRRKRRRDGERGQ